MIQQSLFDPVKDVSRGRKNPNSAKAHRKIPKAEARYAVYRVIQMAGEKGITLEEIAEKLGRWPHQVSGRCTELLALRLIFRKTQTGLTKSGNSCAVYIA
jgi:hypothetical protein